MATLVFGFPANRYHATPWGHHVNEGLVEWPPSPWRLVRALMSAGYTTLEWSIVPETGRRLFAALASVAPSYVAPSVALGHSRHYMPLGKLDKGREKTTLVFDAWARVPEGGELAVTWDVALGDEELALLAVLAKNLNYLGRSESWAEGRLLGAAEPLPSGEMIVPHDGSPLRREEAEVMLLAPMSAESYDAWRSGVIVDVAAAFVPLPGKRPTKAQADKRAKAEAEYPPDLISALACDTGVLQASGWNQPPGSRRLLYRRPAKLLQVSPAPSPSRPRAERVEAVLLTLAHLTGNKHALPHVHRTVAQASRLHQAFASALDRMEGRGGSEELLGRGDQALIGGHRHVHILPLDLDGDSHLEHVLVWAPGGIGARALAAIKTVRKTWAKDLPEILVSYAGSGSIESVRRLAPAWERVVGTNAARVWESVTPFVPPRFLKRHGTNSLEGQIQAELASRGLPRAARITAVPREVALERGYRHFVRERPDSNRSRAHMVWFALRIELEAAIASPLVLGHASHFGLGMFRVVSAETEASPYHLPRA